MKQRRSILDGHLRLSSSTLEAAPEREEPGAIDHRPIKVPAANRVGPVEIPPVYPTAHPSKKREPKERKPVEPEEYSALDLCHVWGLRLSGKDFTNPLTVATHGEHSPWQESTQIMEYVMSTAGYGEAEPVLRHVFVSGKEPSTFDPRRPGETLQYALGRLGWRKRYCYLRLAQIGPIVLARFIGRLMERMDEDPFEFVYIPPEADSGLTTEGEREQWDRLQKNAKKA